MGRRIGRKLASRPPLTTRGWGKYNTHYWRHGGYGDFVKWWAERMFSEAHSTKQIEDAIAWSHDTDGTALALSQGGRLPAPATRRDQIALAGRVRCPVLVVHGGGDQLSPRRWSAALAEATGGSLVVLEGAGHIPVARDPVKANLLIREFAELAGSRAARRWP